MNQALAQTAASSSGGGWALILLILIALSYFVPWVIGWCRGACNLFLLFLVNLFLGWTLVGWVFAMAWAIFGKTRIDRDLAREQLQDIRARRAGP